MFGSRLPQKDRRGRFWEWLNPALGKEVNCWLVGTIVGVETHFTGRTMPCLRYLTGGRMKCYCEGNRLATTWKGYVPLFDANGVQCFAMIGERYADVACKIDLFSPVTVARLKRAGSPICVTKSNWTDAPPPSNGDKLKPKDIRPWLLKLWHDETLNEWLAAHQDDDQDEAGEPRKRGNVVPGAVAERGRMKPAKECPATLDEALKGVPALNGKGRH